MCRSGRRPCGGPVPPAPPESCCSRPARSRHPCLAAAAELSVSPCSGAPRLASARRSPAPRVLVASVLARRSARRPCRSFAPPLWPSLASRRPARVRARSEARCQPPPLPAASARRAMSAVPAGPAARPVGRVTACWPMGRPWPKRLASCSPPACGRPVAPSGLPSPLRGSRPSRLALGCVRVARDPPGQPASTPVVPADHRPSRASTVSLVCRRIAGPPDTPTDEAADPSDATSEVFDPTVCDRPRREAGRSLLPLTTREANPPLDSFGRPPYPFPRSLQPLTGQFDRKDATP